MSLSFLACVMDSSGVPKSRLLLVRTSTKTSQNLLGDDMNFSRDGNENPSREYDSPAF